MIVLVLCLCLIFFSVLLCCFTLLSQCCISGPKNRIECERDENNAALSVSKAYIEQYVLCTSSRHTIACYVTIYMDSAVCCLLHTRYVECDTFGECCCCYLLASVWLQHAYRSDVCLTILNRHTNYGYILDRVTYTKYEQNS